MAGSGHAQAQVCWCVCLCLGNTTVAKSTHFLLADIQLVNQIDGRLTREVTQNIVVSHKVSFVAKRACASCFVGVRVLTTLVRRQRFLQTILVVTY